MDVSFSQSGSNGVAPQTPRTPRFGDCELEGTMDQNISDILSMLESPAVAAENDQPDEDANHITSTQIVDQRVLKGVVAYVEVRSDSENRSKAIIKQLEHLGATVATKFGSEVTHVVFKDGKKSTRERALKRGIHLVSVLWVDSCKQHQEHVSERCFPVSENGKTPVLPMGRLKKTKSMQPKDFDEEVAHSAERLRRKKKRKELADRFKLIEVTPPPASPSLSIIYATETQRRTPTTPLESLHFTPNLIPDTPPSMHERLASLRRERQKMGLYSPDKSIKESPVSSKDACCLQRKLFDNSASKDDSLEHPVSPMKSMPQLSDVQANVKQGSPRTPAQSDRTSKLTSELLLITRESAKPAATGNTTAQPNTSKAKLSLHKQEKCSTSLNTGPRNDTTASNVKTTRDARKSLNGTDYSSVDMELTTALTPCSNNHSTGSYKLKRKRQESLEGNNDSGQQGSHKKRRSMVHAKAQLCQNAGGAALERSCDNDNVQAGKPGRRLSTVINNSSNTRRTSRRLSCIDQSSKRNLSNEIKHAEKDGFENVGKNSKARHSSELSNFHGASSQGKSRTTVEKQSKAQRQTYDANEQTDIFNKSLDKTESLSVTVNKGSSPKPKSVVILGDSEGQDDSQVNRQFENLLGLPANKITLQQKLRRSTRRSIIGLLTDHLDSPLSKTASHGQSGTAISKVLSQSKGVRIGRRQSCISYFGDQQQKTPTDRKTTEKQEMGTLSCDKVMPSRRRRSCVVGSSTQILQQPQTKEVVIASEENTPQKSEVKLKSHGKAAAQAAKRRRSSFVGGKTQVSQQQNAEKIHGANVKNTTKDSEMVTESCMVGNQTGVTKYLHTVEQMGQVIDNSVQKSIPVSKSYGTGTNALRHLESSVIGRDKGCLNRLDAKPVTDANADTAKNGESTQATNVSKSWFSNENPIRKRKKLKESTSVVSNDVPKVVAAEESVSSAVEKPKRPSVSTKGRDRKTSGSAQEKPRRTMVTTNLHSDEKDLVKSVVGRLGGFSLVCQVCESTTHVVCGSNRRTLNVLHAISRGVWLLSLEWVLKSLEAGHWLQEEAYEQHDFFPAAQVSRLERFDTGDHYALDLFSKHGPLYVGENTAPCTTELVQLLKLCGGLVTTCVRKASLCIGTVNKYEVPCVSEQWVLDCITSHDSLPLQQYLKTAAESDENST